MTKSPKICIIGSEGWGSAISTAVCKNVLNNNFHPRVHLYVYDELVRSNYLAEVINERHENVKYLPGIQLPDNLVSGSDIYSVKHSSQNAPNKIAINDLEYATKEADILVFATPHDFVKSYCNILAGNVKSDAYAISLIKGFDYIGNGEIDLYSQTISKKLGIPCYSMMNANCAMEMAQGKLCEITIGCNNKEHAKQLSSLIQTENCMVVVVDDVHGVELCNTLKDLVALSAGFIDGLRLGDNARVACLHLGLKEMMRFIKNFNSTTKVSTCFESCGLANSVATAYVDKNAVVAKTLVTTRKTIQEIESTHLNGRKLHGPIIAQDIYSYLKKKGMQEEYPLFSIVHQICQNKVPPDSIVDVMRYHPDLRSFTITHLQKDEFLTVPECQQNLLNNAIESIKVIRKPLVSEICSDGLELGLDNGDFSTAGLWHPDWDHDSAQKNYMEQAMKPLKESQAATGASSREPDKGSMEFCFEMGSTKGNTDISFNIKDNILETSIIKEDLRLMGSRFTPTRSVSNRNAPDLINPQLQQIGMSRTRTDLIDKGMTSNNKGMPSQFKDFDFDKHDEGKWHEFENKNKMQSQATMSSFNNAAQVIANAYKYDYKISINSRKIPISRSPKNGMDADENEIMKLQRIKPNANHSFSSIMPYVESTNPHSFVESSENFTNVEGSLDRDSPTDFERRALDTTCRNKDHDSDFQSYQQPPMYKTRNAYNQKYFDENGQSSLSPRATKDDLRKLDISPVFLKRHKTRATKKTSEFHKSKEYVKRKKDFIHQAENNILDNEIPYEILSKNNSARDALSDEQPTNEATNERRSGKKFERDDGRPISVEYILEDKVEESRDDRVPKYIESQGEESNKRKKDCQFDRFKIGEDTKFTIFNSNEKYPEPEFNCKDTQKLSHQSSTRDEYNTEYNKLEDMEVTTGTTSNRCNTRDNDSIESKKHEEKNEEPTPKEIEVQIKGAETYPFDTAPSEIESEPKMARISSDAAADTGGIRNKEDKTRQYKDLQRKSNAHTSEWDWLLDNDKFDDEPLEEIKSEKVKKSYPKTDMSKYRHLIDFIAKRDKAKEKTYFPDDLIKITESKPTISKPATEHGNYDAGTEELAASSNEDWQQEKMFDSMPTEKPLLPIDKLSDKAELDQNDMETNKSDKRFSKIMTKGRDEKRQSKEQVVDYDGVDPYNKDHDMLSYLQDKLQDSDKQARILAKPFHPPLNPRVRIPRPPFDVRDHEYHTLNFRPFPNARYGKSLEASIPLSQSKQARSCVPKLPLHFLKLPPSVMRSSVMALEMGFLAALLSCYRGGRK